MNTDELIQIYSAFCGENNVQYTYHSFIQIPQSAHRFSTYNIERSNYYGADLIALMRDDTITVSFFFKDGKNTEDFKLENDFDKAIRGMGEFTKATGYDSTNNLFFSEYTFTTTQTF